MGKKRKKKVIPEAETKREKFIRVVTPRVKKALKSIRLVGNQSGTAYEYTDEDVANIFVAIRLEVDAAEKRYASSGKQDVDFTLD